ncbi:MAG: O-acetyl-ADP-ribose deacetylase [Planctomycetes bacterium]|nr:O-acetyl-ADP-ribose deacetylase [Planctomycetota bacterium]
MTMIEAVKGDITKQQVDAIVNAANSALAAGAGVCGAIHDAAGPELEEECMTLGGCPTGEARITKGYGLLARHVIHTVGPVWHGGTQNEPVLLRGCYEHSLKLAAGHKLKSLAFPAISTGIFGYPIDLATQVAVSAVRTFAKQPSSLEVIRFVCFSAKDLADYERELAVQG